MAWYHVGSCDCPIGNCFCGPETPVDEVWYNADIDEIFQSSWKPEEAYSTYERWWLTDYIETGKWVHLGKL